MAAFHTCPLCRARDGRKTAGAPSYKGAGQRTQTPNGGDWLEFVFCKPGSVNRVDLDPCLDALAAEGATANFPVDFWVMYNASEDDATYTTIRSYTDKTPKAVKARCMMMVHSLWIVRRARVLKTAVAASIGFLAVLFFSGADWTRFRGPNGSGQEPAARPPLRFSHDENLLWKTPLPGFGSSSPIVCGEKVFVTGYSGYGVDAKTPGEMKDLVLHLTCIDRATGRILWDRQIPARLPERAYPGYVSNHGYASHTPVSDGQGVYAYFGRTGLWAYSVEGQPLWNAVLGDGTHEFGTAGSPILLGKLLIVNATIEGGGLVALDKADGQQAWRNKSVGQSWATPALLTQPGGAQQLVFLTARAISAMDPATGKPIWHCAYGGDTAFNSPLVHGNVVFASGGNAGKELVAVRGDGDGDVSQTHVLWRSRKASKIPMPLVHNGLLFCIDDGGVAYCYDARSGELLQQKRTAGPWASPVLVGERIYVVGRDGRAVVLAANKDLDELARCDLSDGSRFHATPVPSGDRLLIRSDKFLYCIGN